MPTPNDQDRKLADELYATPGTENHIALIAAYREQIVRETLERAATVIHKNHMECDLDEECDYCDMKAGLRREVLALGGTDAKP